MSLKDILVILGELSSFLSLLRMAFGLTQAVSHLDPILSHRVRKFSFESFQLVLKIRE